MTAIEHEPRLLTVMDVAAKLNVSESTVRRLIDRDELPSLQLGGQRKAVRIDESEFIAWLYREKPSTETDDAA